MGFRCRFLSFTQKVFGFHAQYLPDLAFQVLEKRTKVLSNFVINKRSFIPISCIGWLRGKPYFYVDISLLEENAILA
jgi:hypothetical protein